MNLGRNLLTPADIVNKIYECTVVNRRGGTNQDSSSR